MTEPPFPLSTPDPLHDLRAGIDAHRQQQDAAKTAAAELREQPPAEPPPPVEGEQ